jgi:hypothetical protein
MSAQRPPRDAEVAAAAEEVPPPAAGLRAALAGMKPVRTRRPLAAAAAVLAAAALRPLHSLYAEGLRPDFWELPALWRTLAALVWAAGLVYALKAAILPPRGAVLPDVAKAARATWLVAAGLIAFGLFATVDGPTTVVPAPTLREFSFLWWHCSAYGVLVILPPLLAGGYMLRRLFPVGARRVAAALGAAAGAAAATALHFLCPIGGGLHVGLAHAGSVLVGAALGTLLVGRVLRA